MQIACPTCDKRLQIADNKLPTDRKVRIICPACQESFTYNPDGTAVLSVPHRVDLYSQNELKPVDPTADEAVASPAKAAALSVPTMNLDVIDSGPPPRALVCVDDEAHRRDYDKMLAVLGWGTVHIMDEQVQAMTYLTQVAYDVVILDAEFDGSTLEANPVLACVAEIPMAQRRNIFVAVCADEQYVYDPIGAYSQNVNLFFSYKDPRAVRHIFEHGLADYKRLYRVYWEICEELGKE
jgi:hypothetical protein